MSTITATDLDTLLAQMRAGDLDGEDWSSLPTFGGDEPHNTQGVWSWDEGRVLVGSCRADAEIIDRIVVDLVNPWSGSLVSRDITGLTQAALDAYPLDEDVCRAIAERDPTMAPAEFLAAYVAAVGPGAAGVVIIGS